MISLTGYGGGDEGVWREAAGSDDQVAAGAPRRTAKATRSPAAAKGDDPGRRVLSTTADQGRR